MPYTHVFSTHAILQEYLTDAIIRQEGIDPERVLVLRVRGSFQPDGTAAYTVLNGDNYQSQGGRNILKHRRFNKRRYASFKTDVLDQLAPGFQMYAPMYTYWYLQVLASKAGSYHVLEDGFGSYQSLEELQRFFDLIVPQNWQERFAQMRRRMVLLPEQKETPGQTIKMLEGVERCYGTLEGCFPWKPVQERVVVKDVFPPSHTGEYEGAWLMATSCLVETGNIDLATYLEILRETLKLVVGRGIKVLYLKLHPAQFRHQENVIAYRKVMAEFLGQIDIREMAQNLSLERIAAGNRIHFITGISTLGFHVASTGSEVYRYHEVIERLAPGATDYLAKTGVEIFHRITRPL
ncbi:hypothetical protein [Neolewinella persica]|uniref:hypothetical protein n=1 Tax=Neolewinella persica TaxID=70998 RepID=UPI00036E68F8|nr:hypothetical protein [Neolewinella persica]